MSNEKKQYRVLHPIGWNGRRERGEIINLTDEEASIYATGQIELVAPAVEEEDVTPLADRPLDTLKYKELQQLAKDMGLDTAGTKADLTERITLARQG